MHLLGTGAAASDAHRTTAMVALTVGDNAVLIDCGGDVLQRAMMAGIPVENISAVILTHEHPDHIGGWALLVEKLWLHGRRKAIPVYGPASALEQAAATFAIYNTERWEGLPKTDWHPVALGEPVEFLQVGPLLFTGAPGEHGVPCLATRVDNTTTGASVCYSSDTKPAPAVASLASGCRVLVHEAGGENSVHSTPAEAAEIARAAHVEHLVLIHLPPGVRNDDLAEARSIFPSIELGEELGKYDF